ncbi:insecticidal delta-endotoxin Cry8Ea1 family protein, partial [Bacillus albus]|uniref:insecticidal delta-endotoxin Cry8Ea1 family protein n=1 Tax=Bacillus albus TaxID=2026189 RepID=UPI001A926536
NEPTAVLQGMDYKDWLVMCENNKGLGNPENFESIAEKATVAAASVVAAIVALMAAPVTGGTSAAAGFAILAGVLPLMFPEDEEKPSIFNDVMKATEELIDQKIDEIVKKKAESELEGLYNLLEHYQFAIKNWKEKNSDVDVSLAIDEVRFRFRAAHVAFTSAMAQFRIIGHELALLPVYAQAANLHLIFLKDAVMYERQWNLEKELHLEELLRVKEMYINHCTKWYRRGLEKIKDNSNKNWVDYNRYRRNMTILVLDIIALFPMYDAEKYNMLTKIETLTRKVYSDPLNYIKGESIAEDEKQYTRLPELYASLNKIGCQTKTTPDGKEEYLIGHTNTFFGTDSETSYEKKYGIAGNRGELIELADKAIWGLETYHSIKNPSIRKMVFNYNNIDKLYYNKENKKGTSQKNHGIAEGDKGEHHLSDMILAAWEGFEVEKSKAYSFAWRHNSIKSVNKIVDDKITQIPAVKASKIGSTVEVKEGEKGPTVKVERGPAFIGGDVVVSTAEQANPAHQLITNSIKIPVKVNVNEERDFKIRIRYATDHNINVCYTMHNAADSAYVHDTVERPISEIDKLNYGDFKYIEFGNRAKLNAGRHDLEIKLMYYDYQLKDSSKLKFVLDKVEFIPVEKKQV